MRQKPEFKPVITRIKLNPEQAVLSCACFGRGLYVARAGTTRTAAANSLCGSGSRGSRRSWPTTYSSTARNTGVS